MAPVIFLALEKCSSLEYVSRAALYIHVGPAILPFQYKNT